ncbi:MAG: hypothetical protein U0791_07305 [Gemmataceae bacterium]
MGIGSGRRKGRIVATALESRAFFFFPQPGRLSEFQWLPRNRRRGQGQSGGKTSTGGFVRIIAKQLRQEYLAMAD